MQENLKLNVRSKPRIIALGCGILAVIPVITAVYLLHDREPSLLARSRSLGISVDSFGDYYWLSSRELLILKPTSTGFAASMVDIDTGVSTPSPALSRQLAGSDTNIEPVLSPNSQWLLTQRCVAGKNSGIALRIDGKRRVSWLEDESTSPTGWYVTEPPIWLTDSNHWLEFWCSGSDSRSSLIRHGIDEPLKNLGKWDQFGWVLGQDRQGRLLEYRMEVSRAVKHSLFAFDLVNGAQAGETVLPVRFAGSLNQIQLSPGRDRVAFVSITGGERIYPRWIVGRIPSLRNYRRPFKLALWVCGVDGKGLHELGFSVDKVRPYGADNLASLSWLPDGKSLSFMVNDEVWVTRAE